MVTEKILVDSSVWIDFLRAGKSKEALVFDELLAIDAVCTNWTIRIEVISGARHDTEYDLLEARFTAVPLLNLYETYWNELIRTRYLLARKGLQASLPDLSIAVMARHYGSPLLTLDRPLLLIAKALSVKLYTPR